MQAKEWIKSQKSKYGLRDYKVGESNTCPLDEDLWPDADRSRDHHYAAIRSAVSNFGSRHLKKFSTEHIINSKTGAHACKITRVK